MTGPVECTLTTQRLTAGESLQGSLRFAPKRNLTINGISWSVTCHEKCVSGTGSNRTTHRHELFTQTNRLAEAGVLRPGLPQAFPFSFAVPDRGPSSLKFPNNELTWSGEVRIDIPKWPDWVQVFPLTVVPSKSSQALAAPDAVEQKPLGIDSSGRPPTAEEAAWFDEVVQQVLQSREDPARFETVLSAVREQAFRIRVDIEEPARVPPALVAREPGTWMFAEYRAREVDLCLFWSAALQPPMPGTTDWCGTATILGYDAGLECLLMKVILS
jgi:hypothetical protein